jgi:hypothetical protein
MSGEGAKSKGGRFNPVGVAALYLARTIEGCFLEQAHGFPIRFNPLTVCTYDLDVEGIVDLATDPGRSTANVRLLELQCSWAEDMAAGREPASWKIAKRLIGTGTSGLLCLLSRAGLDPICTTLCCGDGDLICLTGFWFTIPADDFRKTNCPGHDVASWSSFDPYLIDPTGDADISLRAWAAWLMCGFA